MGKTSTEAILWNERARATCLTISLASTLLIAIQSGLGRFTLAYNFVSSAVWISSLVFWCLYDARLQQVRLPTSALWLLFFAWPFAIPGYLLSTRGVRAFWLVFLYAAVSIGLAIVGTLLPLAWFGLRMR